MISTVCITATAKRYRPDGESSVARRHEDHLFAVDLVDGGFRRDDHLARTAGIDCGAGEHPGFQDVVGIGNFDSRANGARGPIDFITDIGDAAGEIAVRIGLDRDLRKVARAQTREIVLKDIGDHPDPLEIDYRQAVRDRLDRPSAPILKSRLTSVPAIGETNGNSDKGWPLAVH